MEDFNKDFFENKGKLPSLIKKYQNFLSGKGTYFFDVFEFVDIITYYIEELDFDEAEKAIDTALSIYPNESEFIFLKANLLFRNGHSKQAMNMLDNIAGFQAGNPEYHFLKANILASQNDIKEAINEYNKVISTADDEEKNMYLHLIGNSLAIVKKYEEDLKFFLEIPVDDLDEEILEDIASTYEAIGKYSLAIKYYKESLKRDPLSDFSWLSLGEAYLKINEEDKALDAFMNAFAIDYEMIETEEKIADLLFKQEKYEQALLYYLDLHNRDGNNNLYPTFIGDCFLQLKRFDEAEKYYTIATSKGNASSEVFHGLAIIAYERKNFEQALEFINAALNADSKKDPEYINFKAHILSMLEQDNKAMECFAKAVVESGFDEEYLTDYVDFIISNNRMSGKMKKYSNSASFVSESIRFYCETNGKYYNEHKIRTKIESILKKLNK